LIEGDESKIKCSSYIQWNSIDNKLKHKSVEIPEYFYMDPVTHLKLKPRDIIKKSIKLDNKIKQSLVRDFSEEFVKNTLDEIKIDYNITPSHIYEQFDDKQVFNFKNGSIDT